MIYQGRFLAGTNDFAHMIKNTFFRQHVFIVIRIATNDQKNAINFNGVMFFPPVIKLTQLFPFKAHTVQPSYSFCPLSTEEVKTIVVEDNRKFVVNDMVIKCIVWYICIPLVVVEFQNFTFIVMIFTASITTRNNVR